MGKDIFELPFVLAETMLLLLSSITFGFGMLAMNKNKVAAVNTWLFVTFLLGAGFIAMEINEFHHLIVPRLRPASQRLPVGLLHPGGHPRSARDQRPDLDHRDDGVDHQEGADRAQPTRLSCLSLFWHFLDVVWICVFTVVYLMGVCNEHSVDNHGASHGSVKSYLIGFVLSVILTAVPFWMVMDGSASTPWCWHRGGHGGGADLRAPGLLPAHEHLLRGALEPGGTVFTVLIIAIVVVGSLWIMYNLNINMMVH
jgi:cytochrome o ubiquinol oxidase subunit 3